MDRNENSIFTYCETVPMVLYVIGTRAREIVGFAGSGPIFES